MLKLPHTFHFTKPHMPEGPMEFSPVYSEDDELIRAIEADQAADTWVLDDVPDVQGLYQFWSGVEDDIRHDPEWQAFSEG